MLKLLLMVLRLLRQVTPLDLQGITQTKTATVNILATFQEQ
jgi:hypothetical protein